MNANRLALLVAAAFLAAPAAVRAEEHMQPGLWQVTATVELPGLPSPGPTTQTECVSQADAEGDGLPPIEKGACRVTDLKRSGSKVTWSLDCGQVGKGEGEIVYRSSTEYEGWMKLETAGTVVRTTLHAKRVGGC